jgi:ATP-dependent Clp protease ATP-binding subunit ClpC
LSYSFVGPEHFMLAGIRNAVTAPVYESLGVRLENARTQVEFMRMGRGRKVHPDELSLTSKAIMVLKFGADAAKGLGDTEYAPEHAGLGIAYEGENNALAVLELLGVSPERLRTALLGKRIIDRSLSSLSPIEQLLRDPSLPPQDRQNIAKVLNDLNSNYKPRIV